MLNNANNPTSGATQRTESSTSPANALTLAEGSAPTFVAKRDRHMQLINTSVFDKLTQQRVKVMEASLEQRRRQRDMREQAKLNKHFHGMPNNGTALQPARAGQRVHDIFIDGIRFLVADGGSKLIRAPGNSTLSCEHGNTSLTSYRQYKCCSSNSEADQDWRRYVSTEQAWKSVSHGTHKIQKVSGRMIKQSPFSDHSTGVLP